MEKKETEKHKHISIKRLCPVCGKISNGICKECDERINFQKAELVVPNLKICVKCGRCFIGQKTYKNAEEGIKHGFHLSMPGRQKKKLNIESISEFQKGFKVLVQGEHDEEYEEILIIPQRFVCSPCSRMSGKYYEAILQLRSDDKSRLEKASEAAVEIMKPRGISEMKEVEGGKDIYAQDVSSARKAAKALQLQFGAEIKSSAKLHTQDKQTSKNLYRTAIVARIPVFSVKEILEDEKRRPIMVTNTGKKTTGFYLIDGKTAVINSKEKYNKMDVVKTIITKKRPSIEVMNPENYETTEPANAHLFEQAAEHEKAHADTEVEIVVATDSRIYIVPKKGNKKTPNKKTEE